MKVIIAGSRTITDYRHVAEAIEASGWRYEITEVVSGGAQGVDTLGELWAKSKGIGGIPVRQFKPDYKTYPGKVAPVMRNEQMAEYADALILVWTGDPKSGSADMLRRAIAHGLKHYEYIVTQ